VYSELHDHFGKDVSTMRHLRSLRGDALARKAATR
jgi:L-ribulokinase